MKKKEQKQKEPKKSKKQKEVYVEKKGLIGVGDDYHVYHMNSKEKVTAFLLGFGVVLGVIFVFFKNIIVGALAGVIAGIFFQPYYCKYLCEKRKKNLLMQFRDLLEALASSYSSGKNTQGAFTDAYGDLYQIYGKDADIVREMEIVLMGLNSNINIERMLSDFAVRCELDDVQSFADVFEVSVRQGANIKDIITATRDIINDKIEIELEIGTLLAGNKNELSIMMVMPLIIVLSMEGLGSSVSDNSFTNVVIKLIALAIFAGAYVLGRKMTDIKV